METQVLFIQGAGAGAHDADRPLAESLQRALGNGYRVRYPPMPNEHDPQYPAWKAEIEARRMDVRGAMVLVGHSLGGFFLLKLLTETELPPDLVGLFLVATPFVGDSEGWRFPGMALPKEFAGKLDYLPTFLYHSRDDGVVPFEHLALYRSKLLRATTRVFDGQGHQFRNDLGVVADDIRRLMLSSASDWPV